MTLGDVFDGFVGEFAANIKQWQDLLCALSRLVAFRHLYFSDLLLVAP